MCCHEKNYALKCKVSSKLKRAFNVSHFVVLRCIFQMHVTKCLHHITSTTNLQKYFECIFNKKQSHAETTTVDFSQGIESKQRMHFWIGPDIPECEKLLPCQTNSQILRYLHFRDTFLQLFPLTQLSLISQCSGITLRAVRLYESYAYSYPGRMHPCGAWAPGRARKIEFRLTREHFFKIFVNFGVMKNLSFPRDFAKGIESRQLMHSWIACYLRKTGKLLRSNFFLEIDVISSFFWPFYQTVWRPNWSQISPDNRITLRAGRALRVMWIFVVGRMHPCGAWATGRAQKIDLKAHQKALFLKFGQFRSHEKSFLPIAKNGPLWKMSRVESRCLWCCGKN